MMMRSIRKNLQFVLIIVVAAFTVTIYYGYGGRAPMGPGQAEAAAVVNDTPITFNELNAAFSNMMSQYDPGMLQDMDESTLMFFRRLVLENLINNELLFQEAQSRRIRVPDSDVNQQVDRFRESFPSTEDWNRFLRFQGISLRDVREAFRRQLTIEYLVNSLTEDITIPDEEIEKYYMENQEAFTVPSRYFLYQITVPSDEEALEIRDRILDGEDFSALAEEYSTDAFAERGGERGWVSEMFLPSQGRDVIIALQDEGEVTEAIETESGFILYQVTEYQEEQERPFEEVENQIREFLKGEQQQNRLERLLAELRENSEVVISEALVPETPLDVENGIDETLMDEDTIIELEEDLELQLPLDE